MTFNAFIACHSEQVEQIDRNRAVAYLPVMSVWQYSICSIGSNFPIALRFAPGGAQGA